MSDQSRYQSIPKQGDEMSISAAYEYESEAAREAFDLLNAATRKQFRGYGDTKTAARDRAARKAGLTPAQAERVWKNWRTMKHPNGDVYRLLRNTYSHLCGWVEAKADAIDRAAGEIEEANADRERITPTGKSRSALD